MTTEATAHHRPGTAADAGPSFLSLPGRPPKPRQVGITHVIDKGLPLSGGRGDARVLRRRHRHREARLGDVLRHPQPAREARALRERGHPGRARRHLLGDLPVQQKLDDWRRWVSDLGLRHVEISDGTISIPHDVKLEHIASLAQDFVVLSEVGSKDLQTVIAPYRWVELIEAELRAGAWKVITEARETGTAGIFRGDGEVRMGLIDEIVHAIDPNRLLFEAPQKAQQVWFIRKFGPNVNLGNIPPDEVIPLETLRLGLRADTLLNPTQLGNVDGAGI